MNITVIEVWHYANVLAQYYNYLHVCITPFYIINFTTISVYTYIYIFNDNHHLHGCNTMNS
jgi:hypothetical protein